MQINRLEIAGLRNISSGLVLPGGSGNLIYGANGAGKTTVLESIYLLGNAKSFRGGSGQSLVNETSSGLKISAKVLQPDQSFVDFQFSRHGAEKKISVSNSSVPNRSTLVRLLPTMFFGHESVSAQVTSPEARRTFFDWLLFHVEPTFLPVYSHYANLFKQLKASLRGRQRSGEIWNAHLGEAGERFNRLRKGVFEELKLAYQLELESFPGLPGVELVYRCGWGVEYKLGEWLAQRYQDHLRLGYCTVGPHRADFQFRSERGEVKAWASRGQLKAYYGIYFLAVLKYFLKHSQSRPLVLVDDLWAELDSDLANQILLKIMGCHCQVFLTSIGPREELVAQYDMSTFHVEHGSIT